MDRDCNKCINHTSGMCSSWDCKMQTVDDVKNEAVKEYVEAVVAELEKRANDNDRAADRLSGIESKKKITSWRARAEALRDAAEIVRGKE